MRRTFYVLTALAAVVASHAFAGCASDLTATTPGHDQCDAEGHCLSGYVCDMATKTCVMHLGTGGMTGTGGVTGTGGDAGGPDGATTGDSGTGGDGGHVDGGHDDGGGDSGSTEDGGDGGGPLGDAGCGTGETACGNACVDEQTDPNHCGSCTNACNPPVSTMATGAPKCSGASCDVTCNTTTPLECTVTFGHACVDPMTDPQYCNDCNTHCPGGQKCQSGACATACGPKLTACGTSCVDTDSDPNNCGGCGKPCNGVAPYCNAGSCGTVVTGCGTLTSCSVGSLTACADTSTDPTHCGGCTACAADQICVASACKPYIYASAGWECGNGNSLSVYCETSGICVGSGVACP